MRRKILCFLFVFILIFFIYGLKSVNADDNTIQIERTVKYNGSITINLKSDKQLSGIDKQGWTLSENKLELSKEYDKSQKGSSETVKIEDINGNYTEVNIEIPQNVIFISDSGNDNNDGTTVEKAVQTFPKAYEKIGENTGIIVLCGDVTIDSSEKGNFYTTNSNGSNIKSGKTIITGTFFNAEGDTVKSSINNAGQSAFEVNINLNGNTIFEKLNFKSNNGFAYAICGQGNNVTFEESVTCSDAKAYLLGGFILLQNTGKEIPEVSAQNYTLTVNGGTWYSASAANRRLNTPRVMGKIGNANLVINGGRVK